MNVSDAVAKRYSTRAFLDRPVDGALVRELLELAALAPSGGNLQPWIVQVIAGERQAGLKRVMAAKLDAGEREKGEYNVYPPNLWEPLNGRRATAASQRFDATGIADDPAGAVEMQRENFAFFGAPVGLFFSLDRRCGPPQWADVGMMMQTFMLLAVERGLATCPQMIWARWPKTVSTYLEIPESYILYSGMSLGYADESSKWNSFRTARAPLADFATFHEI
jgi:nitroreductase